ncbi:unnamed protein product, partial [Brassica rapa]
VCTDGRPRTSCVCWRTPTDVLDVLCMLTDTQGRPLCADGHPQTSCDVCWRTPTDVLCVLNTQPTWAKIAQTVHGKGQRAESKDQRADMCTDGQPRTQRRPVCADGHPQTSSTDVLCVLTDTHGRPVCADKHTRTASTDVLCVLTYTHEHTQTATDVLYVLCVLMDTHGRPVWADGHTQAHMDSHGRPVCADGQPQTSSTDILCVLADTHGRPVCTEQTDPDNSPRETKSPKQSTGRARVLSPRTNVLICVLMDSHGRPVCADGHTRTHMVSHGRPVCAAGHTRTHRQPQTSCVCWRTPTDVLPLGPKSPEQSMGRVSVLSPRTNVLICVLMDSHRRPVCADGLRRTHTDSHGHPPQTSCVCWRTPTNVLCVLNRQPTWTKMTQTVHGKGQHAESKDQRADMCTDGQPRTSCVHECPVCAGGHPHTHTDTHGQPQTSCVC